MNITRAPPLVWHKHAITKMNVISIIFKSYLELWLEQTTSHGKEWWATAWSWTDEAKLNDFSWIISTFSWLYDTTQ